MKVIVFDVGGIALSLPGFIDAEQGVVKGGGAPSLAYNVGTPVGPRLAEACGCQVWIENDGKAAAIAELERPRKERCLPVQYQRPVERLPRPQGPARRCTHDMIDPAHRARGKQTKEFFFYENHA